MCYDTKNAAWKCSNINNKYSFQLYTSMLRLYDSQFVGRFNVSDSFPSFLLTQRSLKSCDHQHTHGFLFDLTISWEVFIFFSDHKDCQCVGTRYIGFNLANFGIQ